MRLPGARRILVAFSLALPLAAQRAADPVVPTLFVENQGQLDAPTRFHARAPGLEVGFAEGGIWIRGARSSARAWLRFEGARQGVEPEGVARGRAKVSFLRGADPARWQRGLATWSGVVYRGLYRGIDLVVRASGGRLEYDLVVAPGARVADVVLSCEGLEVLAASDGGLALSADGLDLVQDAPRSWQLASTGSRSPVASAFRRIDRTRFGFAVEDRDPAAWLVVDPVLIHQGHVGGSAADTACDVAVGPDGSVFVVGWSSSSDFPVSEGALDRERGGREAVLLKLDPDGRELVYATFLGGDNDDEALALAVDAGGRPFVVGRTRSSNFPVTARALQPLRKGLWDAFAVQLEADGSSLVSSTFLGGSQDDVAWDVALDRRGVAYVCGTTHSEDFPLSSHALQKERKGPTDAFVAKLDTRAGVVIYTTLLGGLRDEEGLAIDVDGAGHAHVVGVTHSLDFPTSAEAYDRERAGSEAFVAKLTFDGGALVWSTLLGGSGEDAASGVAVHANGAVSVCGTTDSQDFPTPERPAPLPPAGRNGFVARLSASGARLIRSTVFGGAGNDACEAMTLGAQLVWAVGSTDSPDFASGPEALQPRRGGGRDGFVIALDRDGLVAFASVLGGEGDEALGGVAVARGSGRIALVGEALGAAGGDALVAVVAPGACGSQAQRRLLGGGCGPSLASDEPRLGRPMSVEVSGAHPEARGVLLLSGPGAPATRLGACELMLDMATLDRPYAFETDARGSGRLLVEVPADAGLCGRRMVAQALVLGRGPLAIGQLTEALLLTFGD